MSDRVELGLQLPSDAGQRRLDARDQQARQAVHEVNRAEQVGRQGMQVRVLGEEGSLVLTGLFLYTGAPRGVGANLLLTNTF